MVLFRLSHAPLFDREHLIFPPHVSACGGNFTSSSVSFKPSDFIFLHVGEMYPIFDKYLAETYFFELICM